MLIEDLFYSKDTSVNDCISNDCIEPELCSIMYTSVREAVARC